MPVAQGINRLLAFKKQSGLGVAASGASGQLVRRETATLGVTRETYSSNEIVSHQQHTGDVHGVAKSQGTINGLLSPLTYQGFIESVLRKAGAATTAITAVSLTIAASGAGYTITRAAGDFLTGGIKIGDVIRLSAGALNANNLLKNILVTGVTATVLTVLVADGSTMTAEGPITGCTVTVPGKKVWVPTTGHTNDYYTFEEWFSDLSRSHLYPDVQIANTEIAAPATGNVTSKFGLIGLGSRTKSGARVLTSPGAETTSNVVAGIAGYVSIGGVRYTAITSATVTIDGGVTHGEPVVGSNFIPDVQRGRIKVSGQFTALYESDTLAAPFDNATSTNLILVLANTGTAPVDFVTITLPQVKLFSDDGDDGEKQIVRTYSFVAELCSSGGASLANHQTICSIQDSQFV